MLERIGLVIITIIGLTLLPTLFSLSSPFPNLAQTRLCSHCDVVFLSTVGFGHVLPTIPLVRSLSLRNYTVHYYADATGPKGLDYVARGTILGDAVVQAGGKLRTYSNDVGLQENEPRLSGMLSSRWLRLPHLISTLRRINPSVVIYDPFNPVFLAAATIAKLPHVALIPHSGPGTMAPLETENNKLKSKDVRDWLLESYGVDLFSLGLPASSWYSKSLNLVMTTSSLYAGLSTEEQRKIWDPKTFKCVGTLYDGGMDDLHPKRTGFPMERILKEKESGKRIVLLSLGSVVTDRFFDTPLGKIIPSHISGNDDGTKVMNGYGVMQRLGDMTGRDFINFVFRTAFEAMGGREEYFVVLVTGRRGKEEVLKEVRDPRTVTEEDAGRCMPLPANFLAVNAVPQLELLKHCSCFITHGGMGSTMESILREVPMMIVPCFGDQPHNSDAVDREGCGVGVRYPLKYLTTKFMRNTVEELSEPDKESKYRVNLRKSVDTMEKEGGVEVCVELIEDLIRKSNV